jgi:hypothetical protein
MPESTRYNKFEHESKLVRNIIKMICYRAETAFANQLVPRYKQSAKTNKGAGTSLSTIAILQ